MQDAQGVWFVCVVGVTSTTMLGVNAIVPRAPEGVPTPCEHSIGFEKGDLHVPCPFRWVSMGTRVNPSCAHEAHMWGVPAVHGNARGNPSNPAMFVN